MLFPDVYVTKFFFKNHLDGRDGSLLELGGGNGNNARLFAEYGWNVTVVDMSQASLDDGRSNWSAEPADTWSFVEQDLRNGLPDLTGPFDVLVGNGSLFYFERHYLESLLTECRSVLIPDALVYFKFRTPEDWRYGRGSELEKDTFRLDVWETGEEGATMAFYEPSEVCDLLDRALGPLKDRVVLLESHENIQNGQLVDNRDVIVWGRV